METIEYVEAKEAQSLGGLRLALVRGIPSPWGEAAKNIFRIKKIPFTVVPQYVGQPNADLMAWTGHRNAPVAVYENERALAGWAEILMLAERLQPEPALLPEDPAQRVEVFGIGYEICGELGFGWCRRLPMLNLMVPQTDEIEMRDDLPEQLRPNYGNGSENLEYASRRCADIVTYLANRLKDQKAKGSPYLVGDKLTAADIWWAAFSVLYDTHSLENNPMPEVIHECFGISDERLDAARDPILLEHRDYIYKNYMTYPIDV